MQINSDYEFIVRFSRYTNTYIVMNIFNTRSKNKYLGQWTRDRGFVFFVFSFLQMKFHQIAWHDRCESLRRFTLRINFRTFKMYGTEANRSVACWSAQCTILWTLVTSVRRATSNGWFTFYIRMDLLNMLNILSSLHLLHIQFDPLFIQIDTNSKLNCDNFLVE